MLARGGSMLYIHQKKELLHAKNTYILTDFDRTLTTPDSTVTWRLLEESPDVPPTYREECQKLHRTYRPIELDTTIANAEKMKKMEEWYQETAHLFSKYHIYRKTIQDLMKSKNGLQLRKDVKPFFQNMKRLGIPVIIVSAGIGDIIEQYLQEQQCLFPNVSIHANFLSYNQEEIMGVRQPLIHSMNKSQLSYPEIQKRKMGLLFGDQIEDIEMSKNHSTINIGFYNENGQDFDTFRGKYDAILTNPSSFETAAKVYIKEYPRQEWE